MHLVEHGLSQLDKDVLKCTVLQLSLSVQTEPALNYTS